MILLIFILLLQLLRPNGKFAETPIAPFLKTGLIHYEDLSPQLIFTCSKSPIETLQKAVKYVQS